MLNEEALEIFRNRGMNPNSPTVSGTNQGPDLFFQQRETVNRHYQILPYVVKKYMEKLINYEGQIMIWLVIMVTLKLNILLLQWDQ